MILTLPRDCTQTILSGTDTFRSGHRKILSNITDTPYNNFGGNRANIEKDMRRIWNADQGYLLCQVDQAGAEALIVAYLCKAARYRALFQNGVKPHTYLALKLFKEQLCEKYVADKVIQASTTEIHLLRLLPFWKELAELIKDSDNWKPEERYYHMGKKTIHAGSYGMRESKFRLSMLKESAGAINLSHEQATKFLVGFHKEFPEIQEWHVRTFAQAKRTKQLRNLLGYPYNITNYFDQNDYKDLIAWVPQSTVACITKQAIVKLQNHIESEKKDWHLLLSDCHDSYLAEARGEITDKDEIAGDVLELGKLMKQFIEIEMTSPFDGSKFRMKSEASVGFNWGPQKKDNPLGLREVKI